MEIKKDINFGDEAKDSITGFKGVVTAVVEFSNGCKRYELTSKKMGENGKVLEIYFDEQRIVVTKSKNKPKVKPRGGPHDAPAKLGNPT